MVEGIIAGVVAAFLWAVIETIRRRWRNKRYFSRLAGRYSIRPKLGLRSDFGDGHFARIRVSGTILQVTFDGLPDKDSVSGEIAMSESFPRSGEGQYQHTKSSEQLWGFWKLQVKNPHVLLVHHMYARRDSTLVTQGFLWERINFEQAGLPN
jgi:hypothetical protein